MTVNPTDDLRLLNLAYRQMQGDFKKFAPELFRGDTQSLTTDASGYIFLPLNSFDIELISQQSDAEDELEPIHKAQKYVATGWYFDGICSTVGTNLGKRRIMVRNAGAAWASLALYVDCLIEYDDLTATSASPVPFVQNRYLNMLTELQAFFFYLEKGKENAKDADKHWQIYSHFLKQASLDFLDRRPHFMANAHPDAGDGLSSPYLSQ